jgi:WD40 repeat protein
VSKEGAATLWDLTTWRSLATVRGLPEDATCAAVSSDGETLAVGCKDRTIHIIDVATGCERAKVTGDAERIECLAFSPDGKTLASGGYEQVIRLWDVEAGKERLTLPAQYWCPHRLAFSPDGNTLAAGFFCTAVTLRDLHSGRELTLDDPLEVHQHSAHYVDSLAFSPDGKTLVSGNDDRTGLWDVASGEAVGLFEWGPPTLLAVPVTSELTGCRVMFDPSGKLVGLGVTGNEVKMWSVAPGLPWGRALWSLCGAVLLLGAVSVVRGIIRRVGSPAPAAGPGACPAPALPRR